MNTLAVSIPTYKRPELLRRCLEALAPQCARRGVGLHVFDDSCSDVNRPVYDDIAARFGCLRVAFNPDNLGIDGNIDQCITAPDARYVWVVGEDDLARENAIDTLLAVLGERQPDYVFINYQYISNDYQTLLHVAARNAVGGPRAAGDFFAELGWATGFLGANVVNKARWDARSTDYMGTYFNHVGKIFSRLAPEGQVEVVAEPLVYNRAESLDSFTWLKDCFEVNTGFARMIDALVCRHPEWTEPASRCLVRFEEIMDLRNLKSILVLRALGVYTPGKYRGYMRTRPLWPLYALVSVLPVPMMRVLYQGYRRLKARRSEAATTTSAS